MVQRPAEIFGHNKLVALRAKQTPMGSGERGYEPVVVPVKEACQLGLKTR